VNLLNIEEKVLALIRNQAKHAKYPDPRIEKQRLQEAREEIERAMKGRKDTNGTTFG
jgi:hypothetical protein